jgi:Protein of unknown function (DUF3800)
MHIYIDESGTFTIPALKKPAMSCVAALVIPDQVHDEVMSRFEALTASFALDGNDLKGRILDEMQIGAVIQLLSQYDVIVEATAVEMCMQTVKGIHRHKVGQADGLIANLGPEHHISLVDDLNIWRRKVLTLPNQLYVQAVCTWELVANTVQKSTLYYCQHLPAELGSFRWFVDSKDKTRISMYDELWSTLLVGALQAKSFRKPLLQLVEGDYTAFERFQGSESETPAHLVQATGMKFPFQYVRMKSIVKENFRVGTPAEFVGLQVVDIVANALRRALNGNLRREGWEGIAGLMVQSLRGTQVLNLIDLSNQPRRTFAFPPSYHSVVPYIDANARALLPL